MARLIRFLGALIVLAAAAAASAGKSNHREPNDKSRGKPRKDVVRQRDGNHKIRIDQDHPSKARKSVQKQDSAPKKMSQDPKVMPDKHKSVNGLMLGSPVKVMDSISSNAASYVTLYNYGAAGCSGDPILIASVATGICYEADEEYTYVDDDEYTYSFYYGDDYGYDYGYYGYEYDDFFGSDDDFYYDYYYSYFYGYFDANSPSTADSNKHSHMDRRDNRGGSKNVRSLRQVTPEGGYAKLRSVEYSVSSTSVNGMMEYFLNTTAYFGEECTGKSVSQMAVMSSECTATPTFDDDFSFDDLSFDDDFSADDGYYAYYGYYAYHDDDDNSYFYYSPIGYGAALKTVVSDSQFVVPDTAGVVTSKHTASFIFFCL
jgi:hypothetical protein